jgi:predicted O-linked N-acetylglucosamine transferase (SPINDLY family)
VTTSLADYEALALRLYAADPGSSASCARDLPANRLTAPLFDTSRFCRHIEAAYATMWGPGSAARHRKALRWARLP